MAVDVESGDYEIADDTLRAGAGDGSEEGTSPEVEAVFDSRFDGELTIPAKTIRWLGYSKLTAPQLQPSYSGA